MGDAHHRFLIGNDALDKIVDLPVDEINTKLGECLEKAYKNQSLLGNISTFYLRLFRWELIRPFKPFMGLQNFVDLISDNNLVGWFGLEKHGMVARGRAFGGSLCRCLRLSCGGLE